MSCRASARRPRRVREWLYARLTRVVSLGCMAHVHGKHLPAASPLFAVESSLLMGSRSPGVVDTHRNDMPELAEAWEICRTARATLSTGARRVKFQEGSD